MKREWIVDVVARLPQGLLSRGWGWLARRRRPRLAVELGKRLFVRVAGIDMSEAKDDVGAYATLEELFVRELRAGARRIDPDPASVVSPVDAVVGACGIVEEGRLVQAKGRTYSLARLLADEKEAERYAGGPYATLYLAPSDYHRVHAPIFGEVREAQLVPGALLPVFSAAAAKIDELFARNERLITFIDSPAAGRLAVAKIGATLVGRITATYDRSVQTNRAGRLPERLRYEPSRPIHKGAELGAFELGSTVVLVAEPGKLDLELAPGDVVRVGQRIGTIRDSAAVAPRRAGRRTNRAPSRRRVAAPTNETH